MKQSSTQYQWGQQPQKYKVCGGQVLLEGRLSAEHLQCFYVFIRTFGTDTIIFHIWSPGNRKSWQIKPLAYGQRGFISGIWFWTQIIKQYTLHFKVYSRYQSLTFSLLAQGWDGTSQRPASAWDPWKRHRYEWGCPRCVGRTQLSWLKNVRILLFS